MNRSLKKITSLIRLQSYTSNTNRTVSIFRHLYPECLSSSSPSSPSLLQSRKKTLLVSNLKWNQTLCFDENDGNKKVFQYGNVLQIPKRSCQSTSSNSENRRENIENESDELEQNLDLDSQVTFDDAAVTKFYDDHQISIHGNIDSHIEKPIFDFTQIDLPEKVKLIMSRNSFSKPTPIQSQALPILLTGRDLIGI